MTTTFEMDARGLAGLQSRWEALALSSGLPPEVARDVFADLAARHAEPWRAYHALGHVRSVLNELEGLPGGSAPEVRLAAWFHDAVYDPRRGDNEARSADLAGDVLGPWLAPDLTARVRTLILATRTHEPGGDEPAAALLDADLAVLGSEPDVYAAYAAAIRREYAWVPWAAFREGRARVLRSFLTREHIYATGPGRARLEARARVNLHAELGRLLQWEHEPDERP